MTDYYSDACGGHGKVLTWDGGGMRGEAARVVRTEDGVMDPRG